MILFYIAEKRMDSYLFKRYSNKIKWFIRVKSNRNICFC